MAFKMYDNCKVYKIYDILDPNQFYIGSTVQRLTSRICAHRKDSKIPEKQGRKLYHYVNDGIGWIRMKIELVEQFNEPMNIEQLRRKEGEYQRKLNPPLNFSMAGRTAKEWAVDNEKHIKEAKHDYYDKHAEKLKAYQVQYKIENKAKVKKGLHDHYIKNAEKIKAYELQYKKDHKEELKKIRSEKWTCDLCNVSVVKYGKQRHCRSPLHQANLKIKDV